MPPAEKTFSLVDANQFLQDEYFNEKPKNSLQKNQYRPLKQKRTRANNSQEQIDQSAPKQRKLKKSEKADSSARRRDPEAD